MPTMMSKYFKNNTKLARFCFLLILTLSTFIWLWVFDYYSLIHLEKVISLEEGLAAIKCEENWQKKCEGALLEENSNDELLESGMHIKCAIQ
jgi:hypothetical protein